MFGTTLLDSGSEINIVSRRMARYLGLKCCLIVIKTVGVGVVLCQQVTQKVELIVEDLMGEGNLGRSHCSGKPLW